MIKVWRICHKKYGKKAFSGEGARKFGSRWNSIVVEMVYTSDSLSLATLEMMVNGLSIKNVMNQVYVTADIPTNLISQTDVSKLPSNWRDYPGPNRLKTIGDDWISKGSSAVLKVPSAVIPSEFSYLINPNHSDFKKITIGPIVTHPIDKRLFKHP